MTFVIIINRSIGNLSQLSDAMMMTRTFFKTKHKSEIYLIYCSTNKKVRYLILYKNYL